MARDLLREGPRIVVNMLTPSIYLSLAASLPSHGNLGLSRERLRKGLRTNDARIHRKV